MPRVLLSHMARYRPVACRGHTESASPGNWIAVSTERQEFFLAKLMAYVYTLMIAHLLIF